MTENTEFRSVINNQFAPYLRNGETTLCEMNNGNLSLKAGDIVWFRDSQRFVRAALCQKVVKDKASLKYGTKSSGDIVETVSVSNVLGKVIEARTLMQ